MTASALSSSTTHTRRRPMPVEEALRWAIREELPKKRDDNPIRGPRLASFHPMWRAGAFGGRVDCWNREPGFPLAMGDPHRDALVIEAQLNALTDIMSKAAIGSATCPLDLLPYPIQTELRGKADLDVLISTALHEVPKWLATCAIHGTRPDVGGGPQCEPALSDNGKVTLWRTVHTPCGDGPDDTPWVTSHDTIASSKGDCRDAGLFCKLHWSRTGTEVVEEQLRYAMWHAALVYLVPALQFLTSIEVLPPRAPATPWLMPAEEPDTAVLLNLHPLRRVALETRRPAGRRTVRRQASPVRHIDPSTYPLPVWACRKCKWPTFTAR